MSLQIAEYTQTAAALAILNEKYRGQLFDVTTTKGMDEAKKARAEVKGYRVALEKVRKEIKALERSRLIDEEAKRITAELLAIEEPIDEQIKAEEARKEAEKAAKAEAARIAAIAAKISALRNRVIEVANQSATIIKAELENVLALELSADEFQEFMPDALDALAETQAALQSALENRITYEAEQARIQEEQAAEQARIQTEREELARLREAEAARQAEQARIEAEARKIEAARLQQEREAQEAELKAQREAQEAELKAQREEQARKDEEIRQQQAVEAARINAEQEAMERQRAELAAQQRKLEEAEQARQRQIKETDPVADLKQALNADEYTSQALDEAYRRGYEAGSAL